MTSDVCRCHACRDEFLSRQCAPGTYSHCTSLRCRSLPGSLPLRHLHDSHDGHASPRRHRAPRRTDPDEVQMGLFHLRLLGFLPHQVSLTSISSSTGRHPVGRRYVLLGHGPRSTFAAGGIIRSMEKGTHLDLVRRPDQTRRARRQGQVSLARAEWTGLYEHRDEFGD